MLTAINSLGDALDNFADLVFNLGERNFELLLVPNSFIAEPQIPTTFQVSIQNVGFATTTYNLALSGLPAGVVGTLDQA